MIGDVVQAAQGLAVRSGGWRPSPKRLSAAKLVAEARRSMATAEASGAGVGRLGPRAGRAEQAGHEGERHTARLRDNSNRHPLPALVAARSTQSLSKDLTAKLSASAYASASARSRSPATRRDGFRA